MAQNFGCSLSVCDSIWIKFCASSGNVGEGTEHCCLRCEGTQHCFLRCEGTEHWCLRCEGLSQSLRYCSSVWLWRTTQPTSFLLLRRHEADLPRVRVSEADPGCHHLTQSVWAMSGCEWTFCGYPAVPHDTYSPEQVVVPVVTASRR